MIRAVRLRVLLLAAAGLAPGTAARADGVEPPPHPVFFEEPDAETAREIANLVTNSFKDLNKVVDARRLLVRRYGPVAVPHLVRTIEADQNEPEVWAAMLTLAAMRREKGPLPVLRRAPPVLVKRLRESPEPWRRAIPALVLGTFYGPPGVGPEPDPPSAGEQGPRSRARRVLADGTVALGERLRDENLYVRTAAALALGKIGGAEAWQRVVERARDPAPDPNPQARNALLLALALLPGSTEGRLEAALTSEEGLDRQVGAFGVGLRAVLAHAKQVGPDPPEQVVALDARLQNSRIRPSLPDGAEAVWARGCLALLGATPGTWSQLYELAVAPSTARGTALAAAQALLFLPAQHEVRVRMARELATRPQAGGALDPRVLAAFLVLVGSDGTPHGVAACRAYLRDPARTPRGEPGYDVRFHAAVGLVRALAAGRMDASTRAAAIEGLVEARFAAGGESALPEVLAETIGVAREGLLADPDARLSPSDVARVEASYRDPDALLSTSPVQTAHHRLDQTFRVLLGLEAVTKAVGRDPQGGREVSRDYQPLRYVLGWLGAKTSDPGATPYFELRDLRADRGVAADPGPAADPARTVDR